VGSSFVVSGILMPKIILKSLANLSHMGNGSPDNGVYTVCMCVCVLPAVSRLRRLWVNTPLFLSTETASTT